MVNTFRVLSEDDLGEIAFFVQENESSPNCYTSRLSPVITIPVLRDMMFNGSLFVAGMFEEASLTGVTIISMPSYYAASTSASLLFTSLDSYILKYALSEFKKRQHEHSCTKIKTFLNHDALENRELWEFFTVQAFIKELTYNEGTNNQVDVLSYFI